MVKLFGRRYHSKKILFILLLFIGSLYMCFISNLLTKQNNINDIINQSELLTKKPFITLVGSAYKKILLEEEKINVPGIITKNDADVTTLPRIEYSLDYFHIPTQKLHRNRSLRRQSLPDFVPQITLNELKVLRHLLILVNHVLISNDIPFMMYSGTLLGSYRHHDIIPWDDKANIIVSLNYRRKLHYLFKLMQPKYILKRVGPHDKFYKPDFTDGIDYEEPCIIINYWSQNATHIWDIDVIFKKRIVIPKLVVFPLKQRPLYNMTLSAPHDTFATLNWIYNRYEQCQNFGDFNLFQNPGRSLIRIDCKKLSKKYGFVHRYADSKGVREVLQFDKQVLTDVIVVEPKYAIADAFSLKLLDESAIPVNLPISLKVSKLYTHTYKINIKS